MPGEHLIMLQNSVQLGLLGDTFPDTSPLLKQVVHSLCGTEHPTQPSSNSTVAYWYSTESRLCHYVYLPHKHASPFGTGPLYPQHWGHSCIKKGLHKYFLHERTIAGGQKIPDSIQLLLVLHEQKRESQERANSEFSGLQPKELTVRQIRLITWSWRREIYAFTTWAYKLAVREIQKRHGRAPKRREFKGSQWIVDKTVGAVLWKKQKLKGQDQGEEPRKGIIEMSKGGKEHITY